MKRRQPALSAGCSDGSPRVTIFSIDWLSLRIDQYWRRFLVRAVREKLAKPETRWMDLCCGTGDLLLSLELERSRLLGPVATPGLGADFCRPMLARAKSKMRRRKLPSVLVEADALEIPLADKSLDLITIAWGFRNLANFQKGLQEAYRLLRANGCLAILEFSRPKNRIWGPLFEFYFRRILPPARQHDLGFGRRLLLPTALGARVLGAESAGEGDEVVRISPGGSSLSHRRDLRAAPRL